MGQQGEDSPLTEDTKKDKESNSKLENIIELKHLKAKAKLGHAMMCFKFECVEVLLEYVVQEAEFHTRALEMVQGLTTERGGKFGTKIVKDSP